VPPGGLKRIYVDAHPLPLGPAEAPPAARLSLRGTEFQRSWESLPAMKKPFEIFPYTENQAKLVLAVIGLLVVGLIITALLYGLKVFAE
jgi:hypothetical protein